jgi:hypothetical protein
MMRKNSRGVIKNRRDQYRTAKITDNSSHDILKSSTPLAAPSLFTTLPKTLMVPHARKQQAPDPSDHSLNIPIPNEHHKPHLAAKSSVNLVTGFNDDAAHERPVQRLRCQLDAAPVFLARDRLQSRGVARTGAGAEAFDPTEVWETYDIVDT